jgi:hypothetical protein
MIECRQFGCNVIDVFVEGRVPRRRRVDSEPWESDANDHVVDQQRRELVLDARSLGVAVDERDRHPLSQPAVPNRGTCVDGHKEPTSV